MNILLYNNIILFGFYFVYNVILYNAGKSKIVFVRRIQVPDNIDDLTATPTYELRVYRLQLEN